MSEYYTPSYPITNELIESQFIEVPNITNHQETANWNKYLDVYEAVAKEKFARYNGVQIALKMIIRWVTMNKSTQDYKSVISTLRITMQSLGSSEVSESEVYDKYMESLVDIFKGQIKLYEKYFDALNILDRKRFQYALRFRGMDRYDLHFGERFSGQDVLNYLNSMISTTHAFDKSIREMRAGTSAHASNQFVQQAIEIFITSAQNNKAKHVQEITYYKNLCTNLGVQFSVQSR